ncbi:MAG: ketopantoate reductase family protein [Desulfobacterales bacterium]|jgi:2-dehydropantoate 2-reductase
MKVAIIGAGAMGSLFGALMAEAGTDVWLLDVRAEQVKAIEENGLIVETDGQTRTVPVRATVDPEQIGAADLTILFVKSMHTRPAAKTAASVAGPSGAVLTLQNGIGNAEIIAELVGPGRTLAGTTAHGATALGPGRIRHAGRGPTKIGPWADFDAKRLRKIAAMLKRSAISTEITADVRSALWGKLLINVGINAITALTGIRNGQILDLEATRKLSRAAVAEAMAVARARRIEVPENAAEHVLEVAAATGANRSSMGQDVDHRRQTEIRAINGAVVDEGRHCGIETPVNQALTALIETLQAHYG